MKDIDSHLTEFAIFCHFWDSSLMLSKALTIEQTVCLGLRYFDSGHFLYSIGDAVHLNKHTVQYAIHFAR